MPTTWIYPVLLAVHTYGWAIDGNVHHKTWVDGSKARVRLRVAAVAATEAAVAVVAAGAIGSV